MSDPSNVPTRHARPMNRARANAVFVVPTGRQAGFRAHVRGHLLELADPYSAYALAPTPDDLLIVSVASDLAWFARRFLRGRALADHVSVVAGWTSENLIGPSDISVTVSVSTTARVVGEALLAALEKRIAARSPFDPLRVHLEPLNLTPVVHHVPKASQVPGSK
jgi:hypothetical protein